MEQKLKINEKRNRRPIKIQFGLCGLADFHWKKKKKKRANKPHFYCGNSKTRLNTGNSLFNGKKNQQLLSKDMPTCRVRVVVHQPLKHPEATGRHGTGSNGVFVFGCPLLYPASSLDFKPSRQAFPGFP